jgi:hypothetical protein
LPFLPVPFPSVLRPLSSFLQQNDNSDVINFLLSTEIIPLCLRIMETGSELSKTVAIFIVQKILLDDLGLAYICQTYERFYAVGTVLSNMVNQLVESQAVRLLKHVVRCYLRLSDNPRSASRFAQYISLHQLETKVKADSRDDIGCSRLEHEKRFELVCQNRCGTLLSPLFSRFVASLHCSSPFGNLAEKAASSS